ncbi:MAG: PilN domain-containing protein [Cyanobacteria bacterium P01_F01_bin.150]
MYSLDINFLNDREDRSYEVESGGSLGGSQINWAPAIFGLLVGLVPLGLVLIGWGVMQRDTARLDAQRAELQAEVDKQGKVAEVVAAAEARAAEAEDSAAALITVFDQIKPWSAMMANVRETIPGGVQVQTIQQSSEEIDGQTRQKVELQGVALSFDDVNDFVLVLRRSPFLDPENTALISSSRIDNPETINLSEDAPQGIEVRQPKVVQYTISSVLSDRPASELLAELESTLAVGLTSRIQTIQNLQEQGDL